MKRPVFAMAFAVLVVLAGCSGGTLLGDNQEDPATSERPETNGTASPGDTRGSTTTTDLSDTDNPPGTGTEGISNVSTLLEAHVAELQELSSYRVLIVEAGQDRSNRIQIRADAEGQEYVGARDGWERDTELYFNDGTQYRLVVGEDEVETNDVTFDRVVEAGNGLLRVLDDVTTTRKNVTTVEGGPVVTHRVTGVTSDAETIETASGVVQIRPDGMIVRLSISVTTSEGSGRLAYAVHDVNETSVTAPEWFSERDLPQTVPEAPQLSIGIDTRDDNRVELVHNSGDSVSSLTVRYTSNGETVVETWDPADGEITVAATYVTEKAPDSGTTFRVIWESEDRSTVVAETEIPG